ncbi:hypothetical protein Micr_00642 [Candidatus Micrarchaeum sp.]|nr:MAG: hypothetical protein JJ59_00825 [Candidatus Micrarchaeum sp. AZ1]OWP53242.1 MAG: hypothetical protein B2I19_04960 [Thermoplasmatales archaeon ARMAN]QRF74114.1 hypothetical protein Micr_00642 [Candidatus Micrarchaeum sp.]
MLANISRLYGGSKKGTHTVRVTLALSIFSCWLLSTLSIFSGIKAFAVPIVVLILISALCSNAILREKYLRAASTSLLVLMLSLQLLVVILHA